MRRDVFQAIADPNRRAILNLLAGQKLSLQRVAEHFDISRPAVSRHVKILAECGLIVVHRHGRQRYCEVRLEKLSQVSEWVTQSQILWNQRLDHLEEYLGDLTKKENQYDERHGRR